MLKKTSLVFIVILTLSFCFGCASTTSTQPTATPTQLSRMHIDDFKTSFNKRAGSFREEFSNIESSKIFPDMPNMNDETLKFSTDSEGLLWYKYSYYNYVVLIRTNDNGEIKSVAVKDYLDIENSDDNELLLHEENIYKEFLCDTICISLTNSGLSDDNLADLKTGEILSNGNYHISMPKYDETYLKQANEYPDDAVDFMISWSE